MKSRVSRKLSAKLATPFAFNLISVLICLAPFSVRAASFSSDIEAIRSHTASAQETEVDAILSTTTKVFDYLFHHPYTDQSISLAKSVSQRLSPEMIERLRSMSDAYVKVQEATKNDPRGTGEKKFWTENKKRIEQIFSTALQGIKVISHETQDGLRGIVYDVNFEGKPMRVSYFLGHDEIKFAPVPEADDVIYQKSIVVPATLLGTTFDLEKRDLTIDTSKMYTVFSRISPQLDIMRDGEPELIEKAVSKVEALFAARLNAFERAGSQPSGQTRPARK
jgi:hypothetical protein